MHYTANDVYSAYAVAVLSIIPLFLYGVTKKRDSVFLNWFLFFSGVLLGTLHYIRAHAGLAVLVFMVVALWLNKEFSNKKRLLLTTCLLLGLSCPWLYFNSVIKTYKAYATEHFPSANILFNHPFWHNFYIGFGYLNFLNHDQIRYSDSYAFEKAFQRDPTITLDQTVAYEAIIKDELFNLIKRYPMFILFTIFAKIGVLLLFLCMFSNIGLIAAYFFPKPLWLEISFLYGFVVNALFPIMVIPGWWYSMGFITLAVLYGIISINEALPHLFLGKGIMKNAKPVDITP